MLASFCLSPSWPSYYSPTIHDYFAAIWWFNIIYGSHGPIIYVDLLRGWIDVPKFRDWLKTSPKQPCLLEIISPIGGWCSSRTFTNPCYLFDMVIFQFAMLVYQRLHQDDWTITHDGSGSVWYPNADPKLGCFCWWSMANHIYIYVYIWVADKIIC